MFTHGQLRLYLLKLLEETPRHGYDVIASLEDRFMGLYAPSAGTVYPRLARLEGEGLIAHEAEGGRKVYRLTPAGREELTARRQELADLEAEITRSVRDLAGDVAREVRGSVRDLKAELKAAAREVRRETRVAVRGGGEAAAAWEGVGRLDQQLKALRRDVVLAATQAQPGVETMARCRNIVEGAREALLAALDPPSASHPA